jgi:hypothetical protein
MNDLTGHQDVDLRETFLESLLEFFETFLRKLIVTCNDFELRDFNAPLSVVSPRSPIWFRERIKFGEQFFPDAVNLLLLDRPAVAVIQWQMNFTFLHTLFNSTCG